MRARFYCLIGRPSAARGAAAGLPRDDTMLAPLSRCLFPAPPSR